ncbi:Protein MxaJ [Candidatus Filomicrobium marinum]|uniref:Protein MxaJ n=1 Tax=Candidatus Filomicrobium marinum TaxID=1608628 RepID=A0A0D6JJV9_9HYPH|nr:methanol oxidation system protein MoxJ [Candidatus Filomicrobium marinum]CFX32479.1 Protein MxaJ [Candidatus Filomicrobium marinum]CPR21967.1 Protein MxaJ [Candidatus Filomicrobium marinum]
MFRTKSFSRVECWLPGALALAVAVGAGFPVKAANTASQDIAPDPSILRVCAAANEHPYSTRDERGFENKIAKAIAEAMGRTPLFVWHNKPAIYLVRDKLNMHVCDVVMGVDTGDERVATSEPYYRAPYVFVERVESDLNITSWESPDLVKADKIGFVPGSPAQVMLTKLDLFNVHFNYMNSLTNFKSRRNQYTRIDPKRLIGEVADGTSDLAVAFAPEVARYVKVNPKLKMVVIPDNNVRVDGEKVPHHFSQSIAVRKEDAALLDAINLAIEKARPQIREILTEEGIPLVETSSRS